MLAIVNLVVVFCMFGYAIATDIPYPPAIYVLLYSLVTTARSSVVVILKWLHWVWCQCCDLCGCPVWCKSCDRCKYWFCHRRGAAVAAADVGNAVAIANNDDLDFE